MPSQPASPNTLYVDSRDARQHGNVVDAIKKIIPAVPVVDQMMQYGDYVFGGKLPEGGDVRVAIELSSVSDVIGKINSNRFDYQLSGMLKSYDVCILMITGNYMPDRDGYVVVHGAPRTMKYKRFTSMLFSAQMHGIVVDNIPAGVQSTAEAIAARYLYWQKSSHDTFRGLTARPDRVFLPTGDALDEQIQALMMWPGIGEDKARAALETVGSIRALTQLDKSALRTIPGWGIQTAANIDNFLSSVRGLAVPNEQ
ncbi:MAG: helix-hairpin-helix domain-containing protein [Porticoccaceae bacterium]|nr:helix-hairpin-helix domain-containing protein [Porticoccaceae bacterium]